MTEKIGSGYDKVLREAPVINGVGNRGRNIPNRVEIRELPSPGMGVRHIYPMEKNT